MPVTVASVPERVSVRLDDEQRARIAAWMNAYGITQVSTAVRSVLDLGLSQADQLNPNLARRMIREGFMQGYSTLIERLAPLIAEMQAETRSLYSEAQLRDMEKPR